MVWNPQAGGWMVARTESGVEIFEPAPPLVVIDGVAGREFYGTASYAGFDLPTARVAGDWFAGADPYYGTLLGAVTGDRLTAGQLMNRGDRLISPNGLYRLEFQSDGNLVLYKGRQALWASNTVGAGVQVVMQTDGNLVVYGPNRQPVFNTGTQGKSGANLVLQNDGNLVVRHGAGAAWNSGTWGGVPARDQSDHSFLSSVVSTVSSIGKTVEDLGNDALKVAAIPAHVAQGALNVITHNPVWDVAQGVMSFIPVIGTAVSSGMAIAAQLGKGGSALDFALAAAKGALPGQPISGYAFDVAVGLLLKGQRIDAQALELARSQCPGGELGKRAFDLAVSIILGKHVSVKDVVVNAAKQALPKVPALTAAFESGVGLAKSKFASPALVQNVTSLIPASARSAFQAGMVAAKANQITPQTLAALKARMPAGAVGKAMQNVVHRAVGTQIAKSQRQVAAVALSHAMRLVQAMNQGHARAKAEFAALTARAKRGDRAALAAISIATIASKELQRRGRVPASPAARHSGEMMIAGRLPLDALGNRLFHSLPSLGIATWAEPHVRGARGNFLVRY